MIGVTVDAVSEVMFWEILLSLIFGPFLLVLIRKENVADHEGLEKPPKEHAEPTSKKIDLPDIDY